MQNQHSKMALYPITVKTANILFQGLSAAFVCVNRQTARHLPSVAFCVQNAPINILYMYAHAIKTATRHQTIKPRPY